MPDSNMKYPKLSRLNYYDGLFLTASLCKLEQNYFRDQLFARNMVLYTPGIVSGLKVSAEGNIVYVEGGFALDPKGHQLIWPSDFDHNGTPLPRNYTSQDSATPATQQLQVYLSYSNANQAYGSRSQPQNTFYEIPEIKFGEPPIPELLLATLTIERGNITGCDNSVRHWSTLRSHPSTPSGEALEPSTHSDAPTDADKTPSSGSTGDPPTTPDGQSGQPSTTNDPPTTHDNRAMLSTTAATPNNVVQLSGLVQMAPPDPKETSATFEIPFFGGGHAFAQRPHVVCTPIAASPWMLHCQIEALDTTSFVVRLTRLNKDKTPWTLDQVSLSWYAKGTVAPKNA